MPMKEPHFEDYRIKGKGIDWKKYDSDRNRWEWLRATEKCLGGAYPTACRSEYCGDISTSKRCERCQFRPLLIAHKIYRMNKEQADALAPVIAG